MSVCGHILLKHLGVSKVTSFITNCSIAHNYILFNRFAVRISFKLSKMFHRLLKSWLICRKQISYFAWLSSWWQVLTNRENLKLEAQCIQGHFAALSQSVHCSHSNCSYSQEKWTTVGGTVKAVQHFASGLHEGDRNVCYQGGDG